MFLLRLVNDRICQYTLVGSDRQRSNLRKSADSSSPDWDLEGLFDRGDSLGFEARVYYCTMVVAKDQVSESGSFLRYYCDACAG